ncbi:MAG: ABC transporter ATP-binding protein [Coriobacteriia bacterium]|nr:ABC transporter ATP-binding protein [Coriobacteriia bacterium]
MQTLELKQLTKKYRHNDEEVAAIENISFTLQEHESLAILGSSGSGKSTLLQLIDGLIKPSSGEILVDGEALEGVRDTTALILQNLGLLPWKTVLENASLGLEIRGVSHAEAQERARQSLHEVALEGVDEYYPQELSGGMKQRLAIARALVMDCDLLLMDEPLSALDALLKEHMQDLLIDTFNRHRYTQILVTHSIEEAALLGTRIAVLGDKPGRIVSMVENPHELTREYRNSSEIFEMSKLLRYHLNESQMRDKPYDEA